MYYVLATALSMLLAFFAQKHRETNRRLFMIFAFLSFIPLTFVAAVRYNIGSDFIPYSQAFMNGAEEYKVKEPLFFLFMRAIRLFTDNPQWMIAMFALVFCGCYYFTIYRESEDPVISILLFLVTREYFCSLNSIRQLTATALLLLAIPFIKKKQWIPSVLILIVAYLFHNAVIAVVILFIMICLNLKPWVYCLLTAGAYLIPKYAQKLIVSFVSIFSQLENYFVNYEPAFESSTFMAFACIFILVARFYKLTEEDCDIRALYNGLAYGMMGLAFAGSTHWAAMRISYFAHPMIILYLPKFLKTIENKKIRMIITTLILAGYSVVCLYITTIANNQGVMNYTTIFHRV